MFTTISEYFLGLEEYMLACFLAENNMHTRAGTICFPLTSRFKNPHCTEVSSQASEPG